jgi:hypothetical protein
LRILVFRPFIDANELISSFQKSLNLLDANIVSSIANFDGALARAASATIIICIGGKGAEIR